MSVVENVMVGSTVQERPNWITSVLGTPGYRKHAKEARDFAMKNVAITTFPEFLLVPSICEEAIYKIAARGIEAFAGHVHSKAERPLHDNSNILEPHAKQKLREICKGISPRMSLGYKDINT